MFFVDFFDIPKSEVLFSCFWGCICNLKGIEKVGERGRSVSLQEGVVLREDQDQAEVEDDVTSPAAYPGAREYHVTCSSPGIGGGTVWETERVARELW